MKLWQCALAGTFLLAFAGVGHADGKAFSGDDTAYRPIRQNEQRAAIDHQNGRERLVINITLNVSGDAEKVVWMFPVPGDPAQNKVDLLDSFPAFWGVDPTAQFQDRMKQLRMRTLVSQMFPVIPLLILMPATFGAKGSEDRHFSVVDSVSKWGLKADVVRADSAAGLRQYLLSHAIDITEENLAAYRPYFNPGFSLVVCRIDSLKEFQKQFPDDPAYKYSSSGRTPCLHVEFNCEKPFYPMLPTATYGDVELPVTLYVMGYVAPECDPALAEKLDVKYFRGSLREQHPFIAGTSESDEKFAYTRVHLRVPARDFTSDFTFRPIDRSRSLAYAEWMTTHVLEYPWVCWFAWTAVCSCLCGALAGRIVVGRSRAFAILGLYNTFTLLGVVIRLSVLNASAYAELWGSAQPRRSIFPWVLLLVYSGCVILLAWENGIHFFGEWVILAAMAFGVAYFMFSRVCNAKIEMRFIACFSLLFLVASLGGLWLLVLPGIQ